MHTTDLKAATVASIVYPHIDCAQHAFGVCCEVGHAGRTGHIALLPKDLDVWPHLQHPQQEVDSACQRPVEQRRAHLTCQCVSVPWTSARGGQQQCSPMQGDSQSSATPMRQPVNAETGRMVSPQWWRTGVYGLGFGTALRASCMQGSPEGTAYV